MKKNEVVIPVIGHHLNAPTYTWSKLSIVQLKK